MDPSEEAECRRLAELLADYHARTTPAERMRQRAEFLDRIGKTDDELRAELRTIWREMRGNVVIPFRPRARRAVRYYHGRRPWKYKLRR